MEKEDSTVVSRKVFALHGGLKLYLHQMQTAWIAGGGSGKSRAAAPNLLGARGWFHGGQFSHGPGEGVVSHVVWNLHIHRWGFAQLRGPVPGRPRASASLQPGDWKLLV